MNNENRPTQKKKNIGYKKVVERIYNLAWEKLSAKELQTLMVLSGYAALEFAESLRIALNEHRESKAFQGMAAGELKTTNLTFDDYIKKGDHSEFLWHFIEKKGISTDPNVTNTGKEYLQKVQTLPKEVRVMSIVSREYELSRIFARILKAKDWSLPGLQAFRYFLEEHIKLDSEEGGHADLLQGFKVDDRVTAFYEARLDLYRVIPTLFTA